MANFTRMEVAQAMQETGMVPVFFHPDLETCKKVLEACYKGGIRVFEYTNRGTAAHRNFYQLARFAEAEFPEMKLGAGTVYEPGTASLYMQEGADFVVSPILSEAMAKTCNRRKVLWIPGTATLSEISFAEELGAEIVKVFPGNVLGPQFVKGALAPQPWSKIMPTGGVDVTEENLKAWFDAGVVCVGMGSKLFPKDLMQAGDFQAIAGRIEETMAILRKVRA